MSSHSRPTCGICSTWSITQTLAKPASSAARATSASVAAVVPGWPGQSKREICRPNSSPSGSRAGARRHRARREGGGTSATGPRPWTAAKPSLAERSRDALGLAQLRVDDVGRDRRRAVAIARAHGRRRRLEDDRVDRHRVALRPAPARPRGASRRGRSCRRPSSARAPAAWRRSLEQLERVLARPLIALAGADHRAQPVRRDDLVRREPRPRPWLFPAAVAPTSTTRHGSGRRSGGPWQRARPRRGCSRARPIREAGGVEEGVGGQRCSRVSPRIMARTTLQERT